jgi:hypothetical protein
MGDLPHKRSTKSGNSNSGNPKEQAGSPKTNDFLVVPSNSISGGDSVPVGIQITAAALASLAGESAKDLIVTQSSIELSWVNQAIATFSLPEQIFDLIKSGQDIHVSTRIKIPNNEASGTLKATVSVTIQDQLKPLTKIESVPLVIEASDNVAVSTGQLVLSLQPTQSKLKNVEIVSVKTIVPKPQAKRMLKEINGLIRNLKSPGAGDAPKLITMTIQKQELLSDEVFLGFNFTPSGATMLEMSWTYSKDDISQNLMATACLPG